MTIIKRLAIALVKITCFLGVGLVTPAHALTSSNPGTTATAVAPGGQVEHEQRLTQMLAAIGDMRGALNRAEFDTEALIESLDYDPDAIIQFVREEIRFEPYEGLLRGAQGTLMGRAGNALDQSLLLAVLLQESGVDARLAYGKLDDVQVMRLVQSFRGQATPVPNSNFPDLQPYFKKVAHAAGVDDTQVDAVMQLVDELIGPQDVPLWETALAGRDFLQAHLGKADITLEPADAEPQLARQSTNYFWVEYKDSASDPWQRVHVIPAGDAFDEQALPVLEYLTDEIPENFQHRLRLSVKLERLVSGKTEVVELMEPWERPVANMTGKRLSFANRPDGIRSLEDLADLSQIEARTTFLVPTINDAPAPGAQAFDLRGRTIALSTLALDSAGAAAIFQTAADKTLDAADALAGLSISKRAVPAADSVQSLHRVWLEYVSIHPSGAERVDERTIWQAPEAMSPIASSALWELATPHGMGVATFEYPVSYLVDRELAHVQSQEPLLRWMLETQYAPAGQPLALQPDVNLARLSFPELSYLSQFDAGIDLKANASLVYRAEPTIVVTRHGLRNTQGGTTGYADVDIVHNRRVVLRTDTTAVRTDPLQAMRMGAWETLIEQTELERQQFLLSATPFHTVTSANRMYQEPQSNSQAPTVLRSAEGLEALAADRLEEPTRLALQQDLQRGYVILAEAPSDSQPLAWWRVDPSTGETLGRASDGRGQTTVEYRTMLGISFAVSTVIGTGMCHGLTNSCSLMACFGTAVVTSAAGVGGFAAAGAAAGGTVAALAAAGYATLTQTIGLKLTIGIGLLAGLATHPVAGALPASLPSCLFG